MPKKIELEGNLRVSKDWKMDVKNILESDNVVISLKALKGEIKLGGKNNGI